MHMALKTTVVVGLLKCAFEKSISKNGIFWKNLKTGSQDSIRFIIHGSQLFINLIDYFHEISAISYASERYFRINIVIFVLFVFDKMKQLASLMAPVQAP